MHPLGVRIRTGITARAHSYSDAGFFLCSANIRLNKFSGNTARVLIGIDNDKSFHTGLSVVKGSGRSHGRHIGMFVEPSRASVQ